MKRWDSKELGHLKYILERRQGGTLYEMAKLASNKIKGRSLDGIMHKMRELSSDQEFDAEYIEIDGYCYPAKSVSGYIVIELPDGVKTPLHIWEWERHYGKVPVGFHIHHRDGNRINNSINNLAIMTATEHLQLHHASRPPETFCLFSFLQEKGLWNEYLDYREGMADLVGDLTK